MTTKSRILAAAGAAALLLGTVSAQPGAPTGHDGVRADGFHAHRSPQGLHAIVGRGAGMGLLRSGFPFGASIGTEIDVGFYAERPAEGVEPTTTLALTVGVDSEAAFLEDFAAARKDASYLVIEIGEQTRSIDLPDADADDAAATYRARPRVALGMLHHAGFEDGDTVTVAFYDGDPDAGASVLQTLAFTYGEDSAIGFREDVRDAAESADWAVVTLPPRTHTLDLSDAGIRDGMRPGFGHLGMGGFGPARR